MLQSLPAFLRCSKEPSGPIQACNGIALRCQFHSPAVLHPEKPSKVSTG